MVEVRELKVDPPVASTEIAAMELDGIPARREGRGVRLAPKTVKEFRTVGRALMIDAFGPDLMMPYDTSPEGRGDKVTGAAVDMLEVMVRVLVVEGVPLARARNQAHIADAIEAAKHRKGRRPLGPRLILRRQRNRPKMITIKHGKTRITTHIEAPAKGDFRMHPGALARLADYVEMEVRRILGYVLKKDVTLSQVYMQFLESRLPGDRATELEWDNYNRLEAICEQLEEYNGTDTFDMVNHESGINYAKFRTAQQIKTQREDIEPEEKRCVAETTARDHVGVFIQVSNWFCSLHGLQFVTIRKPKVHRKGIRHLTWDQVVRLLLAARGWIFDAAGNRIGWHEHAERFECVVRFMMIYLCTGTRHQNILELLWAADLVLGHIDRALMMIVRQGPDATITTKVRGTSDLFGPIVSMVPKWEEKDRKKREAEKSEQLFINVIHDQDGRALAEHQMFRLFREVRELAGLPWAKPHMLKHSGVTFYTHAGMSEEDISQNFSTSSETLEAVYTHLHSKWRKQKKFAKKNFRLMRLRRYSHRSREKAFAAPVKPELANAA